MGYVYPDVKLVTTAVDPEVNHLFHILPGIGKCVNAQSRVVCSYLGGGVN